MDVLLGKLNFTLHSQLHIIIIRNKNFSAPLQYLLFEIQSAE